LTPLTPAVGALVAGVRRRSFGRRVDAGNVAVGDVLGPGGARKVTLLVFEEGVPEPTGGGPDLPAAVDLVRWGERPSAGCTVVGLGEELLDIGFPGFPP
jgi:hypothetical protein